MNGSKKIFSNLHIDEERIIQISNIYRLLKWFGITILGAVFVGVIVELLSMLGMNIFCGYLIVAIIGLLLYFPIAAYYRDRNYLNLNREEEKE